MLFYLGLIASITQLSVADKQCALNQYYDHLTEECEPCALRCSSPPSACKASCATPELSDRTANSDLPGNNLKVLLVVLFVFLGVFITLSLILQFLGRKTYKALSKSKVPCQEEAGPAVLQETLGISGTEENLGGVGRADQEEQSEVTPNSSLPLPSTEEGTTVLVTTKTGQNYSRWAQSPDTRTLYLWRSGTVA